MKYALIAAVAASTLLAGSVLAQTATPPIAPATPATGATGMPAGATSTGIQMGTTATMAVRFGTLKPVDMMSSKPVGTKVYNNQNESIGEIEDLVLENGKTLTGVVLSVGGFLGMGDHYVLVDPSSLIVNQKDGTMKAFIDTSKDNLKNAPTFTYSKRKG